MKKANDRFWIDIQRFIDSIRDEAHSARPDRVSIDFWLFKIERRMKLLKDYLDETKA
jgi:hypothetical protein